MGRRKDCYTDEEKDEIIAHVLVNVSCGRFVSRIFSEDETTESGVKLPDPKTFWKWIYLGDTSLSKDLDQKLAQARARGVEALLDECGEIADDAVNDFIEKHDDKTGNSWWEYQKEHVQRSKLRIETRIKMAQLLQPRKYGPKLDVTSKGERLDSAALLEEVRLRKMREMDKDK